MSAEPETPAAPVWGDVAADMAALGVTYRRFNHWINRGYLGTDPGFTHPGTGYTRRLDDVTLRRAAAMGALLQIGITPGWYASAVAEQLAERGSFEITMPSIAARLEFTYR